MSLRGAVAVAAITAQFVLGISGDVVSQAAGICPGTGDLAYLAEGSTRHGFDEWVLLVNPAVTETAEACITYLTSSGEISGGATTVPPQSRRSVHVNDFVQASSVATRVESVTGHVIAERSMANPNAGLRGAHVGKEIAETSNRWYLPEGSTLGGTETWVLVGNPSSDPADVAITFLTKEGEVGGPAFSIPANSRRSVRANSYVASYDVATVVDASSGVVAERATYLKHSGLVGSTDSPGTRELARTWQFAEGATSGGFETWFLVMNPSETETASVEIDHLTGSGTMAGARLTLGPRSRRSIRAGAYVSSYDVATAIRSDIPIAAERAMYSSHPKLGRGSATSEGAIAPAAHWVFAEGATAGGFETWLLLANSDLSATSEVAITFMTETGRADGPTLSIPPGQRRSVRVDDSLSTYEAGIDASVISGPNVVAERSVFTPAGASHDMTSGPGVALAEPPLPDVDPVVVAVGDAACDPGAGDFNGGMGLGNQCRQMATSDLAISESASVVLMLGDAQYETGDYGAFLASYDPSWGRLRGTTHPVAGNHEYYFGSAPGYYSYFGSAAGDPAKGWYSFDLGSWHIIALNSNCGFIGGCDPGSPQELWLRADLAAHPNSCTLAYWHHPRFSSGMHGQDPSMDAFWRALHEGGAELVLNGHDHNYERFAPQTPDSVSDVASGIREFVIGTGGKDLRAKTFAPAHSEVFDYSTPGVLKLVLKPDGYEWEFKAIPGGVFTDVGNDSCH